MLKLYKYEINDPTGELNETLLDSKLINYRLFLYYAFRKKYLLVNLYQKNMILTDYSFWMIIFEEMVNLENLSHVIHVPNVFCVTCCHLSSAVDIKTLELSWCCYSCCNSVLCKLISWSLEINSENIPLNK